MFCFSCGARVEDGSIFCDKCGALMSDGPENVQKQAGIISGHNEATAPVLDTSSPNEIVQAEEQPRVQAKRPWASTLNNNSVDSESVVSAPSQSFEPPSLRNEQKASKNGNPWGGPYQVEVVENEQPSNASNTVENITPLEPVTTSTSNFKANVKEDSKTSKALKLEGKTLYITLAAIAVIIIILFVALMGKSCSSSTDTTPSPTPSTTQSSNDISNSSTPDTSEDEAIVIENEDSSLPFWGVWTFASKNESEAEKYVSKLEKEGFDSIVVLSSDWENLNSENWYCVTAGTWSTESEANAMVAKLKAAGHSDAYSKYTGKNLADDNTVVVLTVESASGELLSGKVRRDANNYVLADSDNREYDLGELRNMNLSPAELCIAWNEPFARGGYHFKNPGLRAYFESTGWYVDRGNSFNLSGAAATNNSRLRQIAEENTESKKWENLATS